MLVLTAGHNTVTGYQTPIAISHPYAVEVGERVIKEFWGLGVNFVYTWLTQLLVLGKSRVNQKLPEEVETNIHICKDFLSSMSTQIIAPKLQNSLIAHSIVQPIY